MEIPKLPFSHNEIQEMIELALQEAIKRTKNLLREYPEINIRLVDWNIRYPIISHREYRGLESYSIYAEITWQCIASYHNNEYTFSNWIIVMPEQTRDEWVRRIAFSMTERIQRLVDWIKLDLWEQWLSKRLREG